MDFLYFYRCLGLLPFQYIQIFVILSILSFKEGTILSSQASVPQFAAMSVKNFYGTVLIYLQQFRIQMRFFLHTLTLFSAKLTHIIMV